jgi:hypothetical protein
MPSASIPASRRRANQASSSGGSHWPASAGDRGLDRRCALGQDRRAAVGAGRRAGGHHHVFDAVELDRRLGDFGELGRRLALDRTAGGERLADGAELAGLGPALIADARLQYRRRQHVAAVQDRDLRIGNSVRGLERIEFRLGGESRLGDRDPVAQDSAAARDASGFSTRYGLSNAGAVCTGAITVMPSIVIAL